MNKQVEELFESWRAADVLGRSLVSATPLSTVVKSLPNHRRKCVANHTGLQLEGISSLFTPKPANPSKGFETSFTKDTHVWSRKPGYINSSPDELEKFVESVIAEVHEARRAAANFTQRDKSCMVILGEKGIGKTHLQNYLISQYFERFEENSIIWLRINMIRDFGDAEALNIDDWIRAQLAKVLFRYYDPASREKTRAVKGIDRDWRSPLNHYIDGISGISEDRRNYLRNDLQTIVERFRDKRKDEPLDPSWAHSHFMDDVWRAATEAGLAIVVVIDGLDLLSSSVTAKEEFHHKGEALKRYLKAKTSEPVVNLIFQRPDSHASSPPSQKVADSRTYSYYHSRPPVRHDVGPVTGREIFSQRMAFAAKNPDHFDGVSTAELREFNEFVDAEKSGIQDDDGRNLTFMDSLELISEVNARAAVQLMFIAAARFSVRELKGYEFTERAMMGSEPYPPNTYEFQARDGGHLERIAGPDYRQFDVLHLPSIFEYPVAEAESSRAVCDQLGPTIYLLGLRILQIAQAAKTVQGQDLLYLLNCLYDYPQHRSELIIEEFVEYELLKRGHYTMGMSQYVPNMQLELSPKGRIIVDHYLYDVTYLGIGAMTAAFPATCLDSLRGRKSIVANKSCARDSTEEWVFTKIKNSYTMAKILIEANRIQKEALASKYCETTSDRALEVFKTFSDPNSAPYSFNDRLATNVSAIASYVMGGMEDTEKINTTTKLLLNDNSSFEASL